MGYAQLTKTRLACITGRVQVIARAVAEVCCAVWSSAARYTLYLSQNGGMRHNRSELEFSDWLEFQFSIYVASQDILLMDERQTILTLFAGFNGGMLEQV